MDFVTSLVVTGVLVALLSIITTIAIIFIKNILHDKKYNITIISYEKNSNGYRAVTWHGYKEEIKNQVIENNAITIKKSFKMKIEKLSGNYSFPDDECFTPIRKGFFGGKLVMCTYNDGQITWLKPSIDFTQYSAFNSNESQLALQNLKTGYERWKYHQEKPVDIMSVMPWVILIIVLGIGVWLSFNQYAYMNGQTDEFFNKLYTFYTTFMSTAGQMSNSINQTIPAI